MPKAIARVLGLTDRAIRLAPLRADAADILHPLLFIFDTAKQVGQRYFPLGDILPLEEDAAAYLERFLRRDVMCRFATREAHFRFREVVILEFAGKASEANPQPKIPAAGNPENVSGSDLLEALRDPELLERLRHSPNPPRDPRLKR